jgi:hypothetical protein
MSTAMIKPKEGYREFLAAKDNKSLVKLSVRHPGKKEVEAADLEYSGTFNRALLSGLPTQAKMIRELRENEVISVKTEEEIGQLSQDLRVLDDRIRKDSFKDDEEKKQVQADRLTKNKRLNILNREVQDMIAHTADAKASEAQRNFLIACVVEYADGDKKGKRFYEDVEDLTSEQDGSLLNRCLYEYMTTVQNMPSEWDTLMGTEEKTAAKPVPPALIEAADTAAPKVDEPLITV